MVRLVFRPYTQVRRTICTSVSLRASTRVSPGFTLLRHSSPSFGSQQYDSYSNLAQRTRLVDGATLSKLEQGFPPQHVPKEGRTFTFIPRCIYQRVFYALALAGLLDSLVRVSRRVIENHLLNILKVDNLRP